MKKIIFPSVLLVAFLFSCTKAEKKTSEKVFEVDLNPEAFINFENTKKQFNAHSGDFYNGVDSTTVYGAGYVKKVEDTLKGYALDILVSAWVREAVAPAEGAIGISLDKKGGEGKDWKSLNVKPEHFKPNEWIHVQDTFKYQSGILNDVEEIKIFSMKQNGKDFYDVDDLKIKYIFHK